jgi:predicted DNA binding protein|tara:strand:+ start:8211 stop:8822 length:612 start_codon:yes stop_codon:yes gene_type:complete
MREIRFSIKHKGSWSLEAVADFFDVKASLIGNNLWKFEAKDERQIADFLKFFQNHRSVDASKLVFQQGKFAVVHEKSGSEIRNLISKHNCHAGSNMSVANGFENWVVFAENSQDATNLMKDLNKLGEVIVDKMGKYDPNKSQFQLTDKQLHSINLAVAYGYYNWPRKVTLEELATVRKVSRRTYQDHLRKAEEKILRKIVEEL